MEDVEHGDWRGVVHASKNARPYHEDCGTWETNFIRDDWTFMGVYDGHAGRKSSVWLCALAHTHLKSVWMEKLPAHARFEDVDPRTWGEDDARRIADVCHCTSMYMDGSMEPLVANSGSTGCVALRCGPHAFVLWNVGDSRAVVYNRAADDGSEEACVLAETRDHKPNHPHERARIRAAGRTVTKDPDEDAYRVSRGLAMGRAYADYTYKRGGAPHAVVSHPTVTVLVERSPGEWASWAFDTDFPDVRLIHKSIKYVRASRPFVVLATDGLWDRLSTSTVLRMVGDTPLLKVQMQRLILGLVKHACEEEGRKKAECAVATEGLNHDNTTIMVAGCPPRPAHS
jgi:serine/threonine protein phosphatase PrpC